MRYVEDYKDKGLELRPGARVLIWQDETEIEGILEYDDNLWRVRLDEATHRHRV